MRPYLLALLCLVCGLMAACVGPCVFPAADGGVEKYRKYSMEVTIEGKQGNILQVRKTDQYTKYAGNDYFVSITAETAIWEDGGGVVNPNDIRVGLMAHIWLVNCKTPQKGSTNVAAVIWVLRGEYP